MASDLRLLGIVSGCSEGGLRSSQWCFKHAPGHVYCFYVMRTATISFVQIAISRVLVRQAEGMSAFKRRYYSSVGISIAQAESVYSNNLSRIRQLSRVL